jgi:hypothetical protein
MSSCLKFGAVAVIQKSTECIFYTNNDADEAVSVVSLTSSSGGYINGRNSANLGLLIDKDMERQIIQC